MLVQVPTRVPFWVPVFDPQPYVLVFPFRVLQLEFTATGPIYSFCPGEVAGLKLQVPPDWVPIYHLSPEEPSLKSNPHPKLSEAKLAGETQLRGRRSRMAVTPGQSTLVYSVQWLQFFFLLLGGCPTKMVQAQNRGPFFVQGH